jgi:hypothetical protein
LDPFQVAVYGESFFTAARNTFELFRSKGVDVIIADDLSGFALVSGAILGGSVAAVASAIAVVILISDVCICVKALSFALTWTLRSTLPSWPDLPALFSGAESCP